MSDNVPTIAAVATAPGRGGVGVIRISGKNLLPMAQALCGKTPEPRVATYADFTDADGQAIDSGLLLFFAAPASFTGEDVIELQGHGGPVVMEMLLNRCLELGARLAEPGEFTKRAFLNDKLDLAQAEGVADLIDASGRSAARLALRSLKGDFSRRIHGLVEGLITLRMLVEAALDFPEEDIDFLEAADARGKLDGLRRAVDDVLANAQQGAILREGLNVVLVGAPNVGKSSLLNALAGDEVAIVTDIAGTTRDAVRERILIDGVPVHIVDTAGLRETDDVVERIGIERSRKAVSEADVALVLVDPREGLNEKTRMILDTLPSDLKRIEIHSKSDLHAHAAGGFGTGAETVIALSAKTGDGLDALKRTLLCDCRLAGRKRRAVFGADAARQRTQGGAGRIVAGRFVRQPSNRAVCRTLAAGSGRVRRNYGGIYGGRPARRDFFEVLHRKISGPEALWRCPAEHSVIP